MIKKIVAVAALALVSVSMPSVAEDASRAEIFQLCLKLQMLGEGSESGDCSAALFLSDGEVKALNMPLTSGKPAYDGPGEMKYVTGSWTEYGREGWHVCKGWDTPEEECQYYHTKNHRGEPEAFVWEEKNR